MQKWLFLQRPFVENMQQNTRKADNHVFLFLMTASTALLQSYFWWNSHIGTEFHAAGETLFVLEPSWKFFALLCVTNVFPEPIIIGCRTFCNVILFTMIVVNGDVGSERTGITSELLFGVSYLDLEEVSVCKVRNFHMNLVNSSSKQENLSRFGYFSSRKHRHFAKEAS